MYNVTLVGTIVNATLGLTPFKTDISGECLVYLYLPAYLYDKDCKRVETSEVLPALRGKIVVQAMHYYDERFPVFIPFSIRTEDGRVYYTSRFYCPLTIPCNT